MTDSKYSYYDLVRQAAQVALKLYPQPTLENIREAVRRAAIMFPPEDSLPLDQQQLVRELESLYSIWIGVGSILEPQVDSGHIDWLDTRKSEIDWRFWKRYCTYLEQDRGRAPKVIEGLDEITDQILSRLEDPRRTGAWARRGMVVGHVQSGKTSNYTGLICKAADAGYNLIVVLAGLHNSLRSQTQRRLDEEFLGFDSRVDRAFTANKGFNSRIGAGLITTKEYLIANSATSSEQNGDFKKAIARQYNLVPGGNHPVLLVVKKNKSVLTNLIQWATAHRSVVDGEGKRVVRGVPLLVVDDEADQASINTEPLPTDDFGNVDPEHDPAVINGLIRKLLNSFEQNAYVGYTATPFANILIHPDAVADDYGKDLFPESFIVSMPTSSDYIGPEKIFGMDTFEPAGIDGCDGLGMIEVVSDTDSWLPIDHKKTFIPGSIPESLKRAIRSFIVVCAVRASRGQGDAHNSMLIHVTRFKDVQKIVSTLVSDEFRLLKQRLKWGRGARNDAIFDEFRQLWEEEFRQKTLEIAGVTESWEDIESHLSECAQRVKVKTINGESSDVLDYFDSSKPVSVIAIGGNKLSRGLTLEGLSISYYLRASKMYDTLMQMGRWFGFRPGYLDLCRLYTTSELIDWYRHIASAAEELRRDFQEMELRNATPRDFGLRVRLHPAGLIVTAVNKMRSGTSMELSFDNTTSESVSFSKCQLVENYHTFEHLIESLLESGCQPESPRRPDSISRVWRSVDSRIVRQFLTAIEVPEESRRCRGLLMCEYIERMIAKGELTNWTVAVLSKRDSTKVTVCDMEFGLLDRRAEKNDAHRYTIKKLVSPLDETIDLSDEQFDAALRETKEYRRAKGLSEVNDGVPLSWIVRRKRSPENGLLLIYPLNPQSFALPESDSVSLPAIGFAVCFPASTRAERISYKVNNVYWEQEFGRV